MMPRHDPTTGRAPNEVWETGRERERAGGSKERRVREAREGGERDEERRVRVLGLTREGDILVFNGFHIKSNRRDGSHDFTQFQFVEDCGFSGCV